MEYTINDTSIVLPKSRKSLDIFSVTIDGWSNSRTVVVNKKKNETYFQVTSEGNDCNRCSLCREKMVMVGERTGFEFHKIEGWNSLYQKLPGVPKDYSAQTLRDFLQVPVVEK